MGLLQQWALDQPLFFLFEQKLKQIYNNKKVGRKGDKQKWKGVKTTKKQRFSYQNVGSLKIMVQIVELHNNSKLQEGIILRTVTTIFLYIHTTIYIFTHNDSLKLQFFLEVEITHCHWTRWCVQTSLNCTTGCFSMVYFYFDHLLQKLLSVKKKKIAKMQKCFSTTLSYQQMTFIFYKEK